jgi:hypothetical protein
MPGSSVLFWRRFHLVRKSMARSLGGRQIVGVRGAHAFAALDTALCALKSWSGLMLPRL